MAKPSAIRAAFLIVVAICVAGLSSAPQETKRFYLGFDRNEYPGDDAFPVLRKTFAFTSYWLSPPPDERKNSWIGKRAFLRSQGFGFLVLYRGRNSSELKNVSAAEETGREDARDAEAAAEREGFPRQTIIFLDIEEGGRLSREYHAYIHGWLWTLSNYQGGFYCSGIPVREDAHTTITTAEDIFSHLWQKSRAFVIWPFNDMCPPSPGCTFPQNPPSPKKSGVSYADVWQFVRSPRDKQTARHCRGYANDGNCYASSDTAHKWVLDVNSATSADPSRGVK